MKSDGGERKLIIIIIRLLQLMSFECFFQYSKLIILLMAKLTIFKNTT